ncbi:Putative formate dehydrogenase oxidoreductase protein [Halomonas citrativorans]|uniref:Formate dehydrogenase oxidoreductase protein n=1 Tax=Halomonas citrativorans TaxID=2742612 RepID=A0A1R4HP55_9GAMM|nr:FdhF/YdeP family oxidoreductase [Halomonas citrativorans]SJN09327.1 Putative formate dehydrogenase oxidoreductase protein [Halomonas citrativorans]
MAKGIKIYNKPAGGWGALKAVAEAVREEMGLSTHTRALLQMNQPDGFDCPGCAWPDPEHTSSFEFCENGAKAVTWEATSKRVTSEFFETHTVSELWEWSDHQLENQGRLTQPVRFDAETDRFVPVSWEEAFSRAAEALNNLDDPTQAEFYTSGRASNEAAFLYQLFAREFGSNNFPDCSNMCHEPTSIGLPKSIGIGKGTVTLNDFEQADAVFCIGHNPGTNHPRMLRTLADVSKRGKPVVVINPLRERGLERFQDPQSPGEMLTDSATGIDRAYFQVKVGGDVAVFKGIMKSLFDADSKDMAAGGSGLLDRSFIAEHTVGFEALKSDIENTDWDTIIRRSGLPREQIEALTDTYASAENVIFCYGMGITQHRHGTEAIQQMANLLLLRGNMGRPGAGICPLRGHSNVQGDRTVGITEIPNEAFLSRLDKAFGIKSPRAHGHNAVNALAAMRDGRSKTFIGLGGNFAVAMSDPKIAYDAFRSLDLNIQIVTKLNRTCLLTAHETIILPCLGRTEHDIQETGPQSITVEDSMSMVHASRGGLKPASDELRSEPAIIAGLAMATLPETAVDWKALIADYNQIRDKIEAVFPDFFDFNERIQKPGGFRLRVGASQREWDTPDGKAHFLVLSGTDEDDGRDDTALTLTTIRSHDQYNTTIYGLNDRYRGVHGRRDVLFANRDDLADLGLEEGDVVDVRSGDRILAGLTLVDYSISRGSLATYFPEANCLVGLDDKDHESEVPAYKSIPVTITKAEVSL